MLSQNNQQSKAPDANMETKKDNGLGVLTLPKAEKVATSEGPTWEYKAGGQAPYVSPGGTVRRPTS